MRVPNQNLRRKNSGNKVSSVPKGQDSTHQHYRAPVLRGQHIRPYRGFVPNGYDYLGPGNDIMIGPSRNALDQAAKEHDIAYDELGGSAYYTYNDADDAFLKAIQDIPGVPATIARTYFSGKKRIAPDYTTPPLLKNSAEDPTITPNPHKRIRSGTRRQLIMDTNKDVPMESARGVSVGTQASGMKGTQETPISMQKPVYGVPETRTVILPWTQYLSAGVPANNTSACNNFSIRLTSPYDTLVDNLTLPTAGTAIGTGLYNKLAETGQQNTWQATLMSFPAETGAGANTSEAPMWRSYFDKLYDYYTCLGVEYEITVCNPIQKLNADVVVGVGVDTYSTTSTGNVFPTGASLFQMETWPGLQWRVIKSTADGTTDQTFTVFKGYYKPGQEKRNVNNDEDVKTWTKTTEQPSLTETLRIFISRAAFNDQTNRQALNFRIKMKFIIQFKDLKVNYRFPLSGQTAINQSAPADILTLV